MCSESQPHLSSDRPAWGPVIAMALAAFSLVSSEFMPVSLLSPIAADLQITEGQAGQAIAISGLFALITSLSITPLAGKLDRKSLLLSLVVLMIVSGTVVALAPNYLVLMIGRALIGVSIGGFWSLSAATAMRLVSDQHVPRALAVLNGGSALASVLAAPLGSFVGSILGWRWAFFCVVPIAAIALFWKMISLPSMLVSQNQKSRNAFLLLKRPAVAFGMSAAALFFMGQFTLFTYLRPFLESVTHADPATLSLTLLGMGIAGFIGTTLIGRYLENGLFKTLTIIPVLMAIIAASLIYYGASTVVTACLMGVWGLIATAAPVGWWTWMARTLPNDAETGEGLIVAIVQLAIMLGATVGGLLYDADGYQATFGASACILLLAGVLSALAAHSSLPTTSSKPVRP